MTSELTATQRKTSNHTKRHEKRYKIKIMRLRVIGLVVSILAVAIAMATVGQQRSAKPTPLMFGPDDVFDGTKIVKTEAEWQKLLTPAQFVVLRKKGTERAYSGELTNNHRDGVYACAACGLHLFSSKHKFESGTGWPSFYQVLEKKNVEEVVDNSLASETRTEVNCARCGGHLGHVFDDGPEPTGLRYCINSVSLKFIPTK